jgi:hypothetical protein
MRVNCMRSIVLAGIGALLCACGRGSVAPYASGPGSVSENAAPLAATKVYQPLAVGDSWTYICNHSFTIADRVIGARRLNQRTVYELSLQIPSSSSKSTHVVQLLGNDRKGNTRIYGYLIGRKVYSVTPTEIVPAKPVLHKHYDYPAPHRGKVSRIFMGFEWTNKTPLGTFWVAPYFENGATHNYGYSLGRGVMEQDHGPQYQYDCLIKKYVLH